MSRHYDYPDSPLYRLRHSAAHLLAQAVLELYPDAKLGVGPPIENGFYYDFDFAQPLREEDLQQIEQKMREIAQRALDITRFEISREDAERLIREIGQTPYKIELLQAIPEGETISFYQQGDFIDLCRGPHVQNTREIQHFKLLSLAGAYWRGDEKNKMLTRIYGTAFFTQEELEDYLHKLEEAKRRDHRKLGRELGLFMIAPEVGSGLPMLLPKGATVRRVLEEFILHEELKAGYQHVRTPEIANLNLYRTSGHYPYYKDSMYPPMVFEDGEELILRPMNCPHHFLIYKSEPRSYRDLPLRLAELGTVYRYEKSGELSGLIRVRCFTINDAHVFLRPEQIKAEVQHNIELISTVYRRLNLTDFWYRLSLRDPADKAKYYDDDVMWETAENALRQALDELGLQYHAVPGEAAFYGPKLDVEVRDCLGREWTVSTVQLDFLMAHRFDLEYTGEDGKPHRPVIIHRAPIGSFERMLGFLIEHYAGAFPLWLAPVQVAVLPIADRHTEYAAQVQQRLYEAGFRVELDARRETLGYRIRYQQTHKTPYMLIIGDKEVEGGLVAVRSRDSGDLGQMTLETLLERLLQENIHGSNFTET
ncbi:MAG: threonine--tRNA ligase [Fimbriimonadales bacterium]